VTISVLDVRSTLVPPRVVVPSRATARPAAAPRRLPLAVVAAAALGVVEALGLLAVGLTGLDGLMLSSTRPHGAVVAAAVLLLAGWIVLSAGTGASLVDGVGRRGYVAVAHTELFVVAIAAIAAVAVPLPTPADLPLPALLLLALAVSVTKLLLAGSSPVEAWIAAGPRVRERRPDPVARHRLVATVTLAAIGLGLGAVAVGGPQGDRPGGVGAALTAVVTDR
jgi:hypothetical protein